MSNDNNKTFNRRNFLKITAGSLTIISSVATPLIASIARGVEEKGIGKVEGKIREIKEFKYKNSWCMVILEDRCIDCERCMDACRETWKVPEDEYRTRILEIENRGHKSFLPVLCFHCDFAPCVVACPTKASHKRKEDGIVLVDPKKCIGCKVCMLACPYDARYYNEEIKAIDKCTFCQPRLAKGLKPACVEACPAHVRVFGDLNDHDSEVYQLLHDYEKTIRVLKPEVHTKPRVYYRKS
jgi:Fe-S-cluster-containing dehydrogenase component